MNAKPLYANYYMQIRLIFIYQEKSKAAYSLHLLNAQKLKSEINKLK